MGNRELLEITMNLKDNFSKGVTRMKNKSVGGLAKIKRGFQSMGAAIKKSFINMRTLIAAFLALSALRGVVRFLRETAEAAIIQERALVTLNAALMASGNFSVAASEGFEQYATALQDSLGIADEVTLETLGMIEGLTGLSTEALPDAMDAVIQISNLYKVDFKAASLLLGKSLTSNMNAFSRYGIEVDLAGDAQQRLDQIIAGTAAGMVIAEAKMKTFEGQTIRIKNSWGDWKEAIGSWITQSPVVIAIITLMGTWITRLTDSMNMNRDAGTRLVGEGFASIVKGGFAVVRAITAVTKVLTLAAKGALQLSEFYIGVELSIVKFFRTSLISVGGFIKDSLNIIVDGYNKILGDFNLLFGTSFNLIGRVTIDVASTIDSAIAGTEASLDGLGRGIDSLNENLVSMDNLTDILIRAEMELDDVIANVDTSVIAATGNFGSMADAAAEMNEALGGSGGANETLEGTLAILEALSRAIIAIETAIETKRESFIGLLEDLAAAERESIGAMLERLGGGPAPFFDIASLIPSASISEEFRLFQERSIERELAIETVFNSLETALIQSAENLAASIGSGDVARALETTFDDIGTVIAQRVNDSIAKSFQNAEGKDTLTGGILGGLGGGFVGAGFSLITGLFGKKRRRGETAADAIKVEVVNTADLGTAILSALTKANVAGLAAGNINSISAGLKGQARRFNLA